MLHHHLDSNDLLCACHRPAPEVLCVCYIDASHPRLGVDEQRIDGLIKGKFVSRTVSMVANGSAKFASEVAKLEETTRKSTDYGKNILLQTKPNEIHLVGLPAHVQSFNDTLEQLKTDYTIQAYKIALSNDQVRSPCLAYCSIRYFCC